MALISVEEAIQDLRDGKLVILVDDEDRENEGDLIIAAEKVTPGAINFMATYPGMAGRRRCRSVRRPIRADHPAPSRRCL